jgi:hypothetical protein
MIAIEGFFILVLLGLVAVVVLQFFSHRSDRGEKGDAVKTQEEIESHRSKH